MPTPGEIVASQRVAIAQDDVALTLHHNYVGRAPVA